VTRPDGAARLLAAAVTFLPAHRRQWGTAMQAELADLAGPRARWQFAAGCAGVVATRPAVLRRAGYPLLTAAVLGATLWWTGRIAYPPLHWAWRREEN